MMRGARSTGYLALLFVLDLLVVQSVIPIAMQLRYHLPIGMEVLPEWAAEELFYAPTIWLHLIALVVWLLSLTFMSVYTPRKVAFWGDELQRLLVGHTVAALILAGLLYLGKAELPRLMFVYFYVLALILMMGTRLALRMWYWAHRKPVVESLRLLVAGSGQPALRIVDQLQANAWPGMELLGVVGSLDADSVPGEAMKTASAVLGTLEQLEMVIARDRVDAVVIALPREQNEVLANLVARLNEMPVRLYVVPDYMDLAFFDATIERLGPLPVIGLRDPAIDGLQRILKRVMDVVIATVVLLVLSPVLLIMALLIKLEDGGPIFYRTQRVGENGHIFSMLKFRSMVVNADKIQAHVNEVDAEGNLLYKKPDDPRVTRIGKFLRRTSLDEMPQLINVLRGDMSLVGPRPELPWLLDNYALWQRKRFAVPQGMTGWWQINSRSESPLQYLHAEEDLYYVQNYSLWLDIQILWKTLAVVLRGKGAY